jgi:hypothetical protein
VLNFLIGSTREALAKAALNKAADELVKDFVAQGIKQIAKRVFLPVTIAGAAYTAHCVVTCK